MWNIRLKNSPTTAAAFVWLDIQSYWIRATREMPNVKARGLVLDTCVVISSRNNTHPIQYRVLMNLCHSERRAKHKNIRHLVRKLPLFHWVLLRFKTLCIQNSLSQQHSPDPWEGVFIDYTVMKEEPDYLALGLKKCQVFPYKGKYHSIHHFNFN